MKIIANYNYTNNYTYNYNTNPLHKYNIQRQFPLFQARIKGQDLLSDVFMMAKNGANSNIKTPDISGFLKTKGNKIFNENGEGVLIKGLSGNSCTDAILPDLEDLRKLSDLGVECYRVQVPSIDPRVCWEGLPPKDAAIGFVYNMEDAVAKTKAMVEKCLEAGFKKVIIASTGLQLRTKETKAFFEEMAKTYGNDSRVIYEIYAETGRVRPEVYHNDPSWKSVKKSATEIIQEIRKYSPNSLIFVGANKFGLNIIELMRDRLPFENIAYNMHFYTTEKYPHFKLLADAKKACKEIPVIFQCGTCLKEMSFKDYMNKSNKWREIIDNSNFIGWYHDINLFDSSIFEKGSNFKDFRLKPLGYDIVLNAIRDPEKKAAFVEQYGAEAIKNFKQ